MKLTPEQQQALRIAVAEIAGSKRIARQEGIMLCHKEHSEGQLKWGAMESTAPVEFIHDTVPDYPDDLNEVQELMPLLTYEQAEAFEDSIHTQVKHSEAAVENPPPYGFARINASAQQRCIALVMTLAPEKWEAIKAMEVGG